MAGVAAVLRLLWQLTKRDMRSLASVGLNNLFFCVIFLTLGGGARQAFQSTQLFQMVLLLPMLVAIAADTVDHIPKVRERVWPITAAGRLVVRLVGLALSPAFWLVGGVMMAWGGVAAGVAYLLAAVVIQAIVFLFAMLGRKGGIAPIAMLPRFPGHLGGVMQASVRQMLMTLDVYAAALLCFAGVAYRCFDKAPEAEALPIVAMLVAFGLSTYAQQMFGQETAGSMMRYRLLPLAGWKLLLAKDLTFLIVAAALVLPLAAGPGMACSFMAVALGRWPSLREPMAQKAWRFTRGSVRYGVMQVIAGGLAGLVCARVSEWFVAAAACAWVGSIYLGQRWWNRRP